MDFENLKKQLERYKSEQDVIKGQLQMLEKEKKQLIDELVHSGESLETLPIRIAKLEEEIKAGEAVVLELIKESNL